MMYPLKFNSIYKEKIWGGRKLETFKADMPDGNIGESWDITCHPEGISKVINGEYKGLGLDELIKLKGEDLLGIKILPEWFPLMIKLINPREKLSIQVHPTDEYAQKFEGDNGKTEAWYVVDALKDAFVYIGTKDGCTSEDFKRAVETGQLENYMNKVNVKKGDAFFIKSGLVHALGSGLVVLEIEQNSNTTYRIYDYNRGRELNLEKSMDVIDLNLKGKRSKGLKIENNSFSKIYYCLDEHFSWELYDIQSSLCESSDSERFYIFTCVEGEGIIKYDNGFEKIRCGESLLIPACLGKYEVEGMLKILKSYVPDIKKVERDILGYIS
jgi:mannose-6-phosphate isomerase